LRSGGDCVGGQKDRGQSGNRGVAACITYADCAAERSRGFTRIGILGKL
jgi:hypothetical protein